MPIDPVSMDALLSRMNAMREAMALAKPGAATAARAAASAPDFSSALKASIDRVDSAQKASTELAQRFQLGDPKVSLEETMVSMAKANISFQQMIQVRNKVIAAYHDIMNMPI